MTQFTRTQNQKPKTTNALKTGVLSGSLFANSVKNHLKRELASFHTPGHKNNSEIALPLSLSLDLTELPGLDELARPTGVLQDLEKRISEFYSCAQSIVSVNGASAGLIAALMAAKQRKGLGNHKVILPLNCHRAAIHALTLSGLTPVFYKPNWNEEWGIFTHVPLENLESVLNSEDKSELAAVLIVSPSYSGDVSDIRAIARICHDKEIPLIVDEAHGAHLFKTSATLSGADITVQSWHKTLAALTQTGVVHVSSTSLIDADDVRTHMRLISTSSPSYLFLTSIDHTISQLETAGASLVERVSNLTQIVRHYFEKRDKEGFSVWRGSYRTDPWHMLVRPAGLKNYLEAHGVYPETILGSGCLLMFGVGSTAEHVDTLLSTLETYKIKKDESSSVSMPAPTIQEQVLAPRDVLLMPLEVVPTKFAAGRIAAECIAPCPPGFPLCIPGARIDESFISNLEKHTASGVKVVVEK